MVCAGGVGGGYVGCAGGAGDAGGGDEVCAGGGDEVCAGGGDEVCADGEGGAGGGGATGMREEVAEEVRVLEAVWGKLVGWVRVVAVWVRMAVGVRAMLVVVEAMRARMTAAEGGALRKQLPTTHQHKARQRASCRHAANQLHPSNAGT